MEANTEIGQDQDHRVVGSTAHHPGEDLEPGPGHRLVVSGHQEGQGHHLDTDHQGGAGPGHPVEDHLPQSDAGPDHLGLTHQDA